MRMSTTKLKPNCTTLFPTSMCTLILGILCVGQSANANTTNHYTQSQITGVTIYQGTASVKRQLPINGTGEQRLVFHCLSGDVDPNSIQVSADDSVNIGDISIQTLTGDEAKLCQRQGNDGLTATQNQLDEVIAKLDASNVSLAYLKNLSKAKQVNIYNGNIPTNSRSHSSNQNTASIANTSKQIEQSVTEVNLQINALKQQKAQLESQLASDMNASGSVSNRITRVSVRLASRKPSQLNLSYLVEGASWQPQYQANLDTKNKQLKVDLQAIIAQTTGENWQDIPLTLSSVAPSYQTALRDPSAQNLSLYDSVEYDEAVAMTVEPQMVIPAPQLFKGKKMGRGQQKLALPNFLANISDVSGILEYRLPQTISLPSDGRRITTKLDSQKDTADVWMRIAPDSNYSGNRIHASDAYWYAKAPNFDANWVAGDMKLYRDGNYVGSGKYDGERIQKYGIGFGHNSQIIVTELTDDKQSDTKGLFANREVKQVKKSYRVQNKMAKPTKIEMISGIPVAKDKAIKVQSSYLPTPSSTKWQDRTGVIAWEFLLPANQQKTISQTHSIEYPNDKNLSGLR